MSDTTGSRPEWGPGFHKRTYVIPPCGHEAQLTELRAIVGELAGMKLDPCPLCGETARDHHESGGEGEQSWGSVWHGMKHPPDCLWLRAKRAKP